MILIKWKNYSNELINYLVEFVSINIRYFFRLWFNLDNFLFINSNFKLKNKFFKNLKISLILEFTCCEHNNCFLINKLSSNFDPFFALLLINWSGLCLIIWTTLGSSFNGFEDDVDISLEFVDDDDDDADERGFDSDVELVGGSITNFIVLVVVVKAGVIISLFLFMNEFVKGESSMNDSVFFKSSNAKKLFQLV